MRICDLCKKEIKLGDVCITNHEKGLDWCSLECNEKWYRR